MSCFRWCLNVHSVWKPPKMSHLSFSILAFSPIFVLLKLTCLVALFDSKLQVFKNSPKRTSLALLSKTFSSIFEHRVIGDFNAYFLDSFIKVCLTGDNWVCSCQHASCSIALQSFLLSLRAGETNSCFSSFARFWSDDAYLILNLVKETKVRREKSLR